MRQRHSSTSIFMRSETSPADGHTILNRARRAVGGAIVASLLAATALSVPSIASAQNQGKNFKVAADIGLVPFFMKDASGKLDGFSYELAGELAKRMGYDGLEVVDTPFSAIFAGLFASRYDMVAGPVNITAERASQMLFTEPYMAGGLSFLTKKGVAIASLEDLKGKLIAVNNGSFSDRWLQDNQAKYGYEIQRFNKNNDAVQAVAIGRAFANLSETPLARFIAKQTPTLVSAYDYTTDSNYGFTFRKEDTATRNKVEDAIECMKTDGSLAKLHVKWFGAEPTPGSSMTKVYPGYGTPGTRGYDATEHSLRCGK